MAAVGYHLGRSPCLCFYFVSRSWWSLRGRGIISDSCQPSALFGIMFLLGVILRLQKSCCLYSEKQRGDWRWVAGFAPADLKKKKIKFLLHLLEPTCLQKIRELAKTRKGVPVAIITPIITFFIYYISLVTYNFGFIPIFHTGMEIWTFISIKKGKTNSFSSPLSDILW